MDEESDPRDDRDDPGTDAPSSDAESGVADDRTASSPDGGASSPPDGEDATSSGERPSSSEGGASGEDSGDGKAETASGTADGQEEGETGAEADGGDAMPTVGPDYDYGELKPAAEYVEEEGGGPGADSEMPLTAHIEEMLKRLMVVVAVAGVVSVAAYPFTEEVINFLWRSVVGASTRPHLYGVLELLFTKLKVASLAGLILGLPVVVYEAYQFMRPGLYPHERRYYLAAVPTSLVLALLGVSFAYFVVLPALFQYFLSYTKPVVSGAGAAGAAAGTAGIGLALGRTFDLILVLMGYLAIVFQIPLMIMLAMMMGVVTRRWLADRRLLFWGGFVGVSFLLFGPADPTGASPILVSITMILLFEGTLFLVKWTRRARAR